MKYLVQTFILLFSVLSGIFAAADDVTIDTIADYNSWGKTALIVKNGYIELIIMPEIGARIMHYGFPGDVYMAVNTPLMDEIYNPETDQTGPWGSWGYGGYKVWPAPQSIWNWPPPPYLDWGNYTWSVEHASPDSVIIYAKSEVEAYKTPGLQQSRRYKIYKNTTKVVVEQILKNVSSTNTEWSIWEVTQVIKSHDNSGDVANISTYFPSDAAGIKVLVSPKINTTAVNENVQKFNANGNNQKIGALLKEGWACFVDERDEQLYAKVFDIFPTTEEYPDQNTNFQIYVGGTYVEIEVLGPLTQIAQGDSAIYTENWYAANIKGSILTTNNAGAVKSKLGLNLTNPNVVGEYGIFNTGKVLLKYLDIHGTKLGESNAISVEAASKLLLSETVTLPSGTSSIELLAYDSNDKLIGILDKCNLSDGSNIRNTEISGITVYPNFIESGSTVYISLQNSNSEPCSISFIDMNGRKVSSTKNIEPENNGISYLTPTVSPGVYFIQIQSKNINCTQKISVK